MFKIKVTDSLEKVKLPVTGVVVFESATKRSYMWNGSGWVEFYPGGDASAPSISTAPWKCEYCGTLNGHASLQCKGCSASR